MANPAIVLDGGPVAPRPQENQADRLKRKPRTAKEMAIQMVQAHHGGMRSRRQHDLVSELLLLHVDGANDFQWLDILDGARIAIPPDVSAYHKTENLLRPIVDNAIAHHTTMPLRYFAESSPDRKARERAIIDAIWANHVAETQEFNDLFSQALYLAFVCGFCPVHGFWREDQVDDHEPVANDATTTAGAIQRLLDPKPGMVDCFVGNPFDHVFDPGARRGSVHWQSYGRLVPAELVRNAFPDVDGLEGTNRIPTAALYQRIALDWQVSGIPRHGSSIIDVRRGFVEGTDELLQLLFREVLPGVEPDWPAGRLQMVAIPGQVDFRRGQANASRAIPLVDQPLPVGLFSSETFHSLLRADDILGKPWVQDLDNLQFDLNWAVSKETEVLVRAIEAPIVGPAGALPDDMLDIGGYQYLEVEPALAAWRPRVMEWPTEALLAALNRMADTKRRAMYTIGGYQAASRGESPGSRTPYRALIALQNADNTIHGPVNLRFRGSACKFMGLCWEQFKAYGDVAWLIDIVGSEYEHLTTAYVSNRNISETRPKFKLVNAFGATPELQAQEILELMAIRGADGEVFMTTDEARRQWPDQRYFEHGSDPKAVAARRARTVASALTDLAAELRQHSGIQGDEMDDPQVQQAAQVLFMVIERKYPRMQSDDLMAHLNSLSEIVQDETADPMARLAAQSRQQLYYQWQMAMSLQGQPGALQPQGGTPAGRPTASPAGRLATIREQAPGGRGTTLTDVEGQETRPRQSAAAGSRTLLSAAR